MKLLLLVGTFLVVSLGLWNGCLGTKSPARVDLSEVAPDRVASVHVESGTQICVALGTRVAARDARPGDAWEGWVAKEAVVIRARNRWTGTAVESGGKPAGGAVVVLDEVVIPAGSRVTGVVVAPPVDTSEPGALPALAVRAIEVKGRTLSINAGTGQVVAAFPRPRGPRPPAGGTDATVLRFTVDEIFDLQ